MPMSLEFLVCIGDFIYTYNYIYSYLASFLDTFSPLFYSISGLSRLVRSPGLVITNEDCDC